MLPHYIAIVPEGDAEMLESVLRVAAALQVQCTRDFEPHWGIRGVISAFPNLEAVPPNYSSIVIVKSSGSAAGVHLSDFGQPYAIVQSGRSWSLAASHECLEMLADPLGNRLMVTKRPEQADDVLAKGQDTVEILVEVSDPCAAPEYAYDIDGVLVSDFYTPRYFDITSGAGQRYSFTGSISKPREVLPGGYLHWRDPQTDEWFLLDYTDPENQGPRTVKRGQTCLTNDPSMRHALEGNSGGNLAGVLAQLSDISGTRREAMKLAAQRWEMTSGIAKIRAERLRANMANVGYGPPSQTIA
ncbi:hypothetical protein [Azospirillum argentinense]|uniref:Uncharacterized protein n=1 Tax=Azospirillum argentinense TaxID=2970906 RepID=A0A5B0KRA9_9PROT|nr:hypothetical protein [Azospirillum argentinense]KAA1054455.1 hypothetical protein FH063_006711 [Azospirillum argentinense]